MAIQQLPKQLNPQQASFAEPPVWFQVLDLLRQAAFNSPEFQHGAGMVEKGYARGKLRAQKRAVETGFQMAGDVAPGEMPGAPPSVPSTVQHERGPFGLFGSSEGPPTPEEQQLIQMGIHARYQQQLQEVHQRMQVIKQLNDIQKSHFDVLDKMAKHPGTAQMMRDAAAQWGLSDQVEPMIQAAEQEQAQKAKAEAQKEERRGLLQQKTQQDIEFGKRREQRAETEFEHKVPPLEKYKYDQQVSQLQSVINQANIDERTLMKPPPKTGGNVREEDVKAAAVQRDAALAEVRLRRKWAQIQMDKLRSSVTGKRVPKVLFGGGQTAAPATSDDILTVPQGLQPLPQGQEPPARPPAMIQQLWGTPNQ